MDSSATAGQHTWSFFRAGGFDQVKIETGEDIAAIDQLDQKLWAALSCPTRGLEFDNKTLDLIDTDKDGHIRVPEIIAACKWACAMLKDPEQLVLESSELPLAAINDGNPEGKQILASAKQLLLNLGKPNDAAIDIADTTDTARIFAQTRFNGDGIIPADSAGDDFTKGVLENLIAIEGALTDRSGKPGADKAKLDHFFAELQAYIAWLDQAQGQAATILPLGEATAAAFGACAAVAVKVDDYFARCRLAAYDARAQAALNRQEVEYLAIAAKDLSITVEEVAGFPLARIAPDKPLQLTAGLNPAWAGRIEALAQLTIKPILGEKVELSEADWKKIKSTLAGYGAWQTGKQGATVEKLGEARIREILGSSAKGTIEQLIAQDKALEPEANAIATVDKLVRYHRDLYRLLINFVNFRAFYQQEDQAVFQAGRLYLDQRSCDLCIRVEDAGKHAGMALLSRAYIAYCDCTRKGATGTDKLTIAAAFTSGDGDNLMVGRNGVFYDRKGQDWDANIIKIIECPISIRQAFWSPYKRAIRMVEEQIAKRAAAADASATNNLVQAGAVASASGPAPAPAAAPAKPKIDVGTVAALGVAVGAITGAMGVILQAFFGLGMLMPLGVVGLIVMISGPSMLIAWLKLRQRNLAPLLDANGWAVNTHARINIPFGTSLTGLPKLPRGSHRDLRDPYAEKHHGRYWTIVVVLFVLLMGAIWYMGLFHKIAPDAGIPKPGWMIAQENLVAEMKAKEEKAAQELKLLQSKIDAIKAAAAGKTPAPGK